MRWSYSSLNTFRNCPRKWHAVYIQKISDANRYNAKGEDEHKVLEARLLKGRPLTPTLAHMEPTVARLEQAEGERHVELGLCLDKNFEPCAYKDWDNGWLRVKLDYLLLRPDRGDAVYIDWKGGKVRKEDDQIELTAATLFCTYPWLQRVHGSLVFVYHDDTHSFTTGRHQLPLIWNQFLPDVRRLEQAIEKDEFPATPNPLCGWCPHKACPHNTSK